MRVTHIGKAEGTVPGLYDVQFDDGAWAIDLTVGQVRQLAPQVQVQDFVWWDEGRAERRACDPVGMTPARPVGDLRELSQPPETVARRSAAAQPEAG